MNRRKLIVTWVMVAFLAVMTSGCAVVGAAISAGLGYAIYQATK